MARKTLSDRIAERVNSKKILKIGAKNKAAFLSLKQEILASLDDGWSIKTIWETLYSEKKIDFSYQTFCKLVKKALSSNTNPVKKTEIIVKTKPKSLLDKNFDFSNKPNKEDLI